jgi:hypothetical protein
MADGKISAAAGASGAAAAGSWWGLDSALKHNREEFEAYVSMPPMACPNDGEPLRNAPAAMSASGVELYCPYDGWRYPQDYTPPIRPGS